MSIPHFLTGPKPPSPARQQEIENEHRSKFPDRILTILDQAKINLDRLPTIAKSGLTPQPADMTAPVAYTAEDKRTGLAFLLKEKIIWHVTPRRDDRGMHEETKKGFDVKTGRSTVLSLYPSVDASSKNNLKNIAIWGYNNDNKINKAFQEKVEFPVHGYPDYDSIEAAVLGKHPDFELANP